MDLCKMSGFSIVLKTYLKIFKFVSYNFKMSQKSSFMCLALVISTRKCSLVYFKCIYT